MRFKFVAIGDLHLAPGPRNADRLAALDFVIMDACQSPDGITPAVVSAWLWPGDLNDARMSIDDRNALIERAEIMADVAPVLVVPGNHDVSGDLDFLAHLKSRWPIMVATAPQVVRFTLAHRPGEETVDAAIFCLPYPSKANIVAAGFAHADIGRVTTESFELIFMEAAQQLTQARNEGCVTGMIGHVTITGAVASTGQPQIGTELELDPAHLLRLGNCFKVFNHIHKHQRLGDAVYAGSLCRLDWGEVEEKGYLVVECAQDGEHSETFVPIPVPPMYHVEGTLTRDRFDWRVVKGPGGEAEDAPPSWAGTDIRVRAMYASAEREVLDGARARVAQQFEDARRVEFEPIAVTERTLRAPEVVEAHSLNDKLVAWAKLMNVSWSDLIATHANELQAQQDADGLVALIETRLRGLVSQSYKDLEHHPHERGIQPHDGSIEQPDMAPIALPDDGRLF